MSKKTQIFFLLTFILLLSLACRMTRSAATPATAPAVLGPPSLASPQVILQRLEVVYLGQDGQRLIGSGCPGTDGQGVLENVHFIVQGVDTAKKVERVLVAGDNSTLTWEWPCSNDWGLLAKDAGNGTWEVFIAPSLPTEIYTLIFFYDDNSMALGMVSVP